MKIRIDNELRDVKFLEICIEPDRWDRYILNGSLCSKYGLYTEHKLGSLWCIKIRLKDGKILGWMRGNYASVDFNILSVLYYRLLDKHGCVVKSYNDIPVPKILDVYNNGNNNKILFEIDSNGFIKDWNNGIRLYDFVSE